MFTSDVNGQYRQSYYSNSSNIGNASGSVFLDNFRQAMEGDAPSLDQDETARSTFSLQFYTTEGESLAFSIDTDKLIDDAGDPTGDKFFDEQDNVYNAIKAEYKNLRDSGFTSAQLTDEELEDIAEVMSKISKFQQQTDEGFYGEQNSGRYELASGTTVDIIHQEMVVNNNFTFSGEKPAGWTEENPISSLPGFSAFLEFGYNNILPVGTGTEVDDTADSTDGTDDTSGSDDTSSTDDSSSTDSTGDTDTETPATEKSFWDDYKKPVDDFAQYIFEELLVDPKIITMESLEEVALRTGLDLSINDMINGGYTQDELYNKFEELMPYLSQAVSILDEPNTVKAMCNRINDMFDKCFTNDDYSIKVTGNDEIDEKLRVMRGHYDTFAAKVTDQVDALNTFNEENPFSSTTETEVDIIWQDMLSEMRDLVEEFFGEYAGESITEFVEARKLEEGESNNEEVDDTPALIGPSEGVAGSLYSVIRENPYKVEAGSEAENTILKSMNSFTSRIYDLKYGNADPEPLKMIFDSTMPYVNKALTLLEDPQVILDVVNNVQDIFQMCLLEEDTSVPESYSDSFAEEVKNVRDGMSDAVRGIATIAGHLYNLERTPSNESYYDGLHTDLDNEIQNFIKAIDVDSYTRALTDYTEKFADKS